MDADIVNRFQKFALSTGEDEGISLAKEDYKLSQVECSRGLLGKVHGVRQASFQGIKAKIWRINGELKVRELRFNLFHFILPSKEDCQKYCWGVPGHLMANSWSLNNGKMV